MIEQAEYILRDLGFYDARLLNCRLENRNFWLNYLLKKEAVPLYAAILIQGAPPDG